jgi:hypothetical protein
MSRLTMAVYAVLLALFGLLMGCWWGYSKGLAAGELRCQAAHDKKAVGDLTELITSSQALVAEANQASSQLRVAAAKRRLVDQQFLKGFDDALLKTADTRSGCVFEPGLMQQLGEAKQRASNAAAGVPGSAGAAVHPASGHTGSKR